MGHDGPSLPVTSMTNQLGQQISNKVQVKV